MREVKMRCFENVMRRRTHVSTRRGEGLAMISLRKVRSSRKTIRER